MPVRRTNLMGTSRRTQPARLAAKLLQIRQHLDLTQEQMVKHLKGTRTPIYVGHISGFEKGTREPSLPVLLRYARVAGVSTDVLIDDDLDLPDRIPPHLNRKRK
jgi:transcriptional regulator with XRE-family HTH domain